MSLIDDYQCIGTLEQSTSFLVNPALHFIECCTFKYRPFLTMKAGIVGFHPTRYSLQAKPATRVLISLAGFHRGDKHY